MGTRKQIHKSQFRDLILYMFLPANLNLGRLGQSEILPSVPKLKCKYLERADFCKTFYPLLTFPGSYLSGIVFLLGISGSRPISWEGSISSNFKNPSDVHESVQYSARDIYCLSWLKLYKISERLYAEAGHTGSSYLEHPPKSQLLSLQWRRKKEKHPE